MSWRSLLLGTASLVSIHVPVVAYAQSDATPAAEERDLALEEIIVTAQKRSENLQTTPIAITALTGEALQSKGIQNIADLGPSIPNVVISGASSVGNSAASFFIRGIGLDRSTLALEAGVGLYIDDVYYGRSAGAFLSLLDVASIEVLRGPQGTLFGKNTIGGAIRYVTKQPEGERGGYIEANVGQRRRIDIRGAVNVPFTDTLTAKISAGSFNVDGYVKNLVDGRRLGDEHTDVVRGQLKWEPTSRLTITGSADFTSSRNGGPPISVVFINSQSPLAKTWNQLHPDTPLDDRYSTDLYENNRNPYSYNLKGYGLNLTAAYEVSDDLTLKSITGYRRNEVFYGRDDDGSPLRIYEITFSQTLPSFSQELQFIGSAFDKKVEYVGGLYYFWEGPSERQDRNIFFEPAGSYISEKMTSRSYAAFGQATAELLEGLKLTIGGRYTHDVKSDAVAKPLQNLAGKNKATFNDFSPKGVLAYQWTPAIMTYASISKGYRAGGFNNSLTANEPTHSGILPFGAEEAWSYELGAKTQLFHDRLRFNVAAFHNDYDNLQLTSPLGTVLLIQNIGKARIRGAEVETELALLPGLSIGGSFGYLDARYLDVGATTAVKVDSPLAGAPEYSYSLNGSYAHELANGGRLSLRADYGWKSSIKSYASDAFAVIVPSVGLVNAQIRYETPDRTMSIALQGRNITNEKYIATGFNTSRVAPGLIGPLSVSLGRPSEYYVTMSYKF